MEPESVSTLSDQDRYLSLNNHRALNPSISGTEQSSQYSTQRGQGLSTCSEEKLYNLSAGGVRDYCNTNKSKAIKSSTGERTPRLRIAKDSSAARRQTPAPPKIHVTGPKRESVSLSSIWLNIINSLYTFYIMIHLGRVSAACRFEYINCLMLMLAKIMLMRLDQMSNFIR